MTKVYRNLINMNSVVIVTVLCLTSSYIHKC